MSKIIVVGDRITPVVGWRVWYMWPTFAHERPALRSLTSMGRWAPGMEAVAQHGRMSIGPMPTWLMTLDRRDDPHAAPQQNCTCGIHAMKTLALLQTELGMAQDIYRGVYILLGRVALWGRVVVGPQGWRGEFAYPQSFYVHENQARSVPFLREFGVPVLPIDELVQATAAAAA